jgi:hypothetical protein
MQIICRASNPIFRSFPADNSFHSFTGNRFCRERELKRCRTLLAAAGNAAPNDVSSVINGENFASYRRVEMKIFPSCFTFSTSTITFLLTR